MSAYGQNSVLAISFQDSAGTSNVDSLHFVPFTSEGLALIKEPLTSEQMRGIFDEGPDSEGMNSVEGDVEVEAQSIALGAMLTAVFGKPTTTAVGSGFEHVWTPQTSDWSTRLANLPVTVYKHLSDPGSAHVFYDLNGSSIELSSAAGEFLNAIVSFVGGKEEQIEALTPSYPDEVRWPWDVASLQLAPNSGDSLSALDTIMDFTITVDEQLEAQHTHSATKTPSRIKRTGFRTVEVSGTMKFEDQDEYQQYKAQSERAFQAHFRGPAEISSGVRESLTIDIPAFRLRELPPSAEGAGPIEVSFTAAGKYHTGSGTAIQVTLVNTQAAY